MQGKALKVEIDEQIVYSELPVKRNSIWSLLLASGYLEVIKAEFVERTGHWYYEMKIA